MSFYDNLQPPILVEPGVKYFLSTTLKQCKDFKEKYNNVVFNIGGFLLFIGVVLCILIYKYKGKLNTSEKRQQELQKQEYILSKIKNYQDAKRKESQDLITGLPSWNNEFDTLYKNNNNINISRNE
jgi:hypothetical protein